MSIRFAGGVLAVALILGGYLLADRFYDTGGTYQPNTPEDVDQFLESQPLEIFRALKAGFPDEYALLTRQISEAMINEAEAEAIEFLVQDAIVRIHQQYAETLLSAPDAGLTKLLVLSRDLHADVRQSAGRVVCNQFATGGPAALGPHIKTHLAAIDRQEAAVLTLIAEVRALPPAPPAQPATAEAWQEIRDIARQRGTDAAALASLDTLDVAEGDICAGLTGLFDAVLEDPAPRGHQLRASLVQTLANK